MSDKLLSIANKVRLLSTQFYNSSLVEKVLVTIPKRYEASINNHIGEYKGFFQGFSSRSHTCFTSIGAKKLMRQDHMVEGALLAKG